MRNRVGLVKSGIVWQSGLKNGNYGSALKDVFTNVITVIFEYYVLR